MYSIGDPLNPRGGDERFEDYDDAEDAAVKASIDDCIWAVWDESGQVLALAFQQDIFT